MTPKFSKSALLIAAMATAVSLTSLTPASAKTYWISTDAEVAEVVPAKFKFKKHHGFKHGGFKHGGFKKKKFTSSRKKSKKLILKKLF